MIYKMKKNKKIINITTNCKGQKINVKKKSNKKINSLDIKLLNNNNDKMFPPIKNNRNKTYNIFQNNLKQINNNINISINKKEQENKIYNSDFQRIINRKNNETTNDDIKKYIELLKNNDNEFNSLKYKKAILYDKRTYFEYYISLLKNKSFFNIFILL